MNRFRIHCLRALRRRLGRAGRRPLFASALAVAALAAPRAHAEEPTPPIAEIDRDLPEGEAEALHAEGKRAIAEGDYVRAVRHLTAAAKKERSHAILGNLGQVEAVLAEGAADHAEASTWWVRAATHLSESLRAFPADGAAAHREAIEEQLAKARAHVVTIDLEASPSSACATIGGRDVGCGPFAGSIFAAPGDVVVELEAPDHAPKALRLTAVAEGAHHTLMVPLERRVAPAASAPLEEAPTSDAPLVEVASSAGALALVAFIAGGVLWKVGGDKGDEAASLLSEGQGHAGREAFCVDPSPDLAPRCQRIEELVGAHDDYRNAAIGTFVAGGALMATMGALLIANAVSEEDTAATARIEIAPWVGLRDGGVLLRGQW